MFFFSLMSGILGDFEGGTLLDDKMIYRLRRFLQHGRIGIGVISLALPGLILSALGVKNRRHAPARPPLRLT